MRPRRVSASAKRLLDIVLCICSLPITLPLAIVVAIMVKATSPGPVLHHAKRVGRNGSSIVVLKFRTMRTNCGGPGVTRSGDDRITSAGRVLRASKLDELPQIINVLRGDMSVVGPRPEDPKYVAGYSKEQRQVLSVRPGMTSLAFLRFGHEQDFIERAEPSDVEAFYLTQVLPEKLDIELTYVREWSVSGDLRIIARTFASLFD